MIYAIINKETEITVKYYDVQKEAEKVAKEMTEYHQKEYIVKVL